MVQKMVHCVIMMTVLFLAKASAQCNHGEVRLQDGCVPNEGRVEVCACTLSGSCSWGTVCDDHWDNNDAQVVCRQLGYRRPDGAMAFRGARFGQGHGNILLDNVNCNGGELTLFECHHLPMVDRNCVHSEDAGVRCSGCVDSFLFSESITNLSVNIINNIMQGINLYTALISWKFHNISQYQPNSFQVECFSHQHHYSIRTSVNYMTLSTHLVGLIPSTSYNCCVSAVYEVYTTRGVCIEMTTIQPPTSQPNKTPMIQPSGTDPTVEAGDISTIKPNESPTVESGDNISTIQLSESPTVIQLNTCKTQGSTSRASANTIGGILGCIIAILLILLAISGAVLVYLLRQRFLGKVLPNISADRNSNDIPVRRNLIMNYATTPSHSTVSGPQAVELATLRAAGQSETDAAADLYSRIGPSYEATDSRRQQPAVDITGRNRVPARISERYEFSEAHPAMALAGGGGGGQGKAAMDYEVLQNLSMRQIIEEHEEYSRLQH